MWSGDCFISLLCGLMFVLFLKYLFGQSGFAKKNKNKKKLKTVNVVCCSSEQIIKRCLQHSDCGVPVVYQSTVLTFVKCMTTNCCVSSK